MKTQRLLQLLRKVEPKFCDRAFLFGDLQGSTEMWEPTPEVGGVSTIGPYRATLLHNLAYIVTLSPDALSRLEFLQELIKNLIGGNEIERKAFIQELRELWTSFLKEHGIEFLDGAYKGELVKQIGDEVMISFRAPEHHMKRGHQRNPKLPCNAALFACLFVRKLLASCNDKATHGPLYTLINPAAWEAASWPIQTKAVLHYAEDLLKFAELDFLGKEVNRAARLSKIPKGSQIVCTGEFVRKLHLERQRLRKPLSKKLSQAQQKLKVGFSKKSVKIKALKGIRDDLKIYPLCTLRQHFDLSIGAAEALIFMHTTRKFQVQDFFADFAAEVSHVGELLDHNRYMAILTAPTLADYVNIVLNDILVNRDRIKATYSYFTHHTGRRLDLVRFDRSEFRKMQEKIEAGRAQPYTLIENAERMRQTSAADRNHVWLLLFTAKNFNASLLLPGALLNALREVGKESSLIRAGLLLGSYDAYAILSTDEYDGMGLILDQLKQPDTQISEMYTKYAVHAMTWFHANPARIDMLTCE